MMFERFSEAARQVVVLAQESARHRASHVIEDVDLLAGAARLPGDVGPLLRARGLGPGTAGPCVAGAKTPEGHLPFAPDAKTALANALRVALAADHDGITPAHLVLGVLYSDDAPARARLLAAGLDPAALTTAVRAELVDAPADRAPGFAQLSSDWTSPAHALPSRAFPALALLGLVLCYALLVLFAKAHGAGAFLGTGRRPAFMPVVAPVLLFAVSAFELPRRYRARIARERRRGAVLPVPEVVRATAARYGVAELLLLRQTHRGTSYCLRRGGHGCIVLWQPHLAAGQLHFVLAHELGHLLRNDHLTRRVARVLAISLAELAFWADSLGGVLILLLGAVLLDAGWHWIGEFAADGFATRWHGRAAAAAFFAAALARHRLPANRTPRLILRRSVLGLFAHPPLSARRAWAALPD